MVDLPRAFRVLGLKAASSDRPQEARRVGVIQDAIGGADRLESLGALFPQVLFESLGRTWPERPDGGLDILIVGVDAADPKDVEAAIRRLGAAQGARTVIVLRGADVATTRALMRAGAADVLPTPVSEPALALCLERLLEAEPTTGSGGRRSGQVVALLKAGGGVGATALGVQMAIMLAGKGKGEVCFADFDLQFGAAGVHLDLNDAVTVSDCLGTGAETPFATALARHRSGARLLAAPREILPLEALNPDMVDGLLSGLRRDFALTLVDLPAVWTAWSNQVLQQADHIVLVTHLSVAHIHLVKRQLRFIASQRLEERPMTLVCNAASPEQLASVPLKVAEKGLGRAFDVVIPKDRKTMIAALNEGVELSAIRRGTPLEKAITELAGKVGAPALVAGSAR
jgi:pilus assembly protein CpaE